MHLTSLFAFFITLIFLSTYFSNTAEAAVYDFTSTQTPGNLQSQSGQVDGVIKITDHPDVVYVNGLTFSDNTVNVEGMRYSGAAIFGDTNSHVHVTDTIFDNNSTGSGFGTVMAQSGGAIYMYLGGSLVIDNSSFQANEAAGAGGAILNFTDNALLTDTDFTNNISRGETNSSGTGTTAPYTGGGAIYSARSMTVSAFSKDVIFSGNQAMEGGHDIHMGGTDSDVAGGEAYGKVLNLNAADGYTLSFDGGIDGHRTQVATYAVNINNGSGLNGIIDLTRNETLNRYGTILHATDINLYNGTLRLNGVQAFGSGEKDLSNGVNVAVIGGLLDIGSWQTEARSFSFSDGGKLGLTIESETVFGNLLANTISFGATTQSTTKFKITVEDGAFTLAPQEEKTFDIFNVSEGTVNIDASLINQNFAINGNQYIGYIGSDNLLHIKLWDTTGPIDPNPDPGPDEPGTDIPGQDDWSEICSKYNLTDGNLCRIVNAWMRDEGDFIDELNNLYLNDPHEFKNALIGIAPNIAPIVATQSQEIGRQLFNLVEYRLKHASNYAPTRQSYGERVIDPHRAGALWVLGAHGDADYSKAYAYDATNDTLAVGLDFFPTKDMRLGLGYGYTTSDIDSINRTIDQTTHSGFIYGEYNPGALFWNIIASYGRGSYEEESTAAGFRITADYDTDVIAVSSKLGYSLGYMRMGDWLTGDLVPNVGARYFNIQREAYTDSLGQQVDETDMNVLTGLIGLMYDVEFPLGKSSALRTRLGASATYDFIKPKGTTDVIIPSGRRYTIIPEEQERFGVEAEARASLNIAQKVQIGLTYQGLFKSDYQNHTGLIDLRLFF